MTFNKPNIYTEFIRMGDTRYLIDLIENYKYTDEEVSEVINIYKPDENGRIPEVEHILTLLVYFPKAKISDETMDAIKISYPDTFKYITKLQI